PHAPRLQRRHFALQKRFRRFGKRREKIRHRRAIENVSGGTHNSHGPNRSSVPDFRSRETSLHARTALLKTGVLKIARDLGIRRWSFLRRRLRFAVLAAERVSRHSRRRCLLRERYEFLDDERRLLLVPEREEIPAVFEVGRRFGHPAIDDLR